jgi:hypothetical protein
MVTVWVTGTWRDWRSQQVSAVGLGERFNQMAVDCSRQVGKVRYLT